MENRMNKEEVLELLETLELDKNEYSILSTSALVLRDIYEDAEDIDIAVSENGFKMLKNNYDLISKGDGWYIVTNNIECVIDDDFKSRAERCEDYYLEDLEVYCDYLQKSNEEKDIEKLRIIENYLKDMNH